MRQPKIIIVGGGLAGLMAAIKVAETGVTAELFSIVPVKRSHSVCAQGGINAAKNLKGEGDSTWKHFDDTIYGGDFLANQPLVKGMCEAAPGIIDLLDRMGVMFNRTPEGLLDFRRFGGTLYHRTAFAGATTGQQLLYALDEQVRRFEAEDRVKKFEGWTFLSAVLDRRRRVPRHLRHGFEDHGDQDVRVRRRDFLHRAASALSLGARRIRWCAPARRNRLCSSRALTTRTANSFKCIPPRFPAKTNCV